MTAKLNVGRQLLFVFAAASIAAGQDKNDDAYYEGYTIYRADKSLPAEFNKSDPFVHMLAVLEGRLILAQRFDLDTLPPSGEGKFKPLKPGFLSLGPAYNAEYAGFAAGYDLTGKNLTIRIGKPEAGLGYVWIQEDVPGTSAKPYRRRPIYFRAAQGPLKGYYLDFSEMKVVEQKHVEIVRGKFVDLRCKTWEAKLSKEPGELSALVGQLHYPNGR